MIILEAVAFNAYFPLSDNKDENKSYTKLKYKAQIEYIKEIIAKVGYGKPDIADHYLKLYKKSLNTATGKVQKIIFNTMFIA